MKFTIKNINGDRLNSAMRRVGYHFTKTDDKTGEESYIREFGANDYPRFHIFARERNEGQEFEISIHFDHKRESYGGVVAHSGEYQDSELLDDEVMRIQGILTREES